MAAGERLCISPPRSRTRALHTRPGLLADQTGGISAWHTPEASTVSTVPSFFLPYGVRVSHSSGQVGKHVPGRRARCDGVTSRSMEW